MVKATESLYLQNKVNCEYTMKQIEYLYGPFDQEEIDFYYNQLEGKINPFQKGLIFNLFYKYFGDPVTINSINMNQYIKLLIASKRLLEGHNLRILPYIISGKVVKLIKKKSINKKEFNKLNNSAYFKFIIDMFSCFPNTCKTVNIEDLLYMTDTLVDDETKSKFTTSAFDDDITVKLPEENGIVDKILSLIATLMISTFKIIDFENPELNGTVIDAIPSIISEEVLMYLLLI